MVGGGRRASTSPTLRPPKDQEGFGPTFHKHTDHLFLFNATMDEIEKIFHEFERMKLDSGGFAWRIAHRDVKFEISFDAGITDFANLHFEYNVTENIDMIQLLISSRLMSFRAGTWAPMAAPVKKPKKKSLKVASSAAIWG